MSPQIFEIGGKLKKPFLSIDELSNFETRAQGKYGEKYAEISSLIGAAKLGYSLSIVPPGKRVCPFHNHHINEEMFFILEGIGTLRFGTNEYSIKKHDIIACPPGGREVAHQIINTGQTELKYLCFSTKEPYDICEYPDSNKVMSVVDVDEKAKFRHISKIEDAVDYLDGEN